MIYTRSVYDFAINGFAAVPIRVVIDMFARRLAAYEWLINGISATPERTTGPCSVCARVPRRHAFIVVGHCSSVRRYKNRLIGSIDVQPPYETRTRFSRRVCRCAAYAVFRARPTRPYGYDGTCTPRARRTSGRPETEEFSSAIIDHLALVNKHVKLQPSLSRNRRNRILKAFVPFTRTAF